MCLACVWHVTEIARKPEWQVQNKQDVARQRWAQREGRLCCACPVGHCKGFGFFSELNRKLLESFSRIATGSDLSFHRITLAAVQRREVMGRAGH